MEDGGAAGYGVRHFVVQYQLMSYFFGGDLLSRFTGLTLSHLLYLGIKFKICVVVVVKVVGGVTLGELGMWFLSSKSLGQAQKRHRLIPLNNTTKFIL